MSFSNVAKCARLRAIASAGCIALFIMVLAGSVHLQLEQAHPALAEVSLSKTASPTTYSAVGQTITYDYLIRNTGDFTLTALTLTDGKIGTVSCPTNTLISTRRSRLRTSPAGSKADFSSSC